MPGLRIGTMALLLAILGVEVLIGFTMRIRSADDLIGGDHDFVTMVSSFGLLWLLVTVVAVVALCRRLWSESFRDHRRTSAIAKRIDNVLETRDLQIALQPIIDLTSRRWIGAEALARFPDGRGSEQWFAEAHEAGRGLDLELLAVDAALDVMTELPDWVYLSVNASPEVLLDARFTALLRRPGLPLNRLVVEITEHAEVRRYDDVRDGLRPFRERGLRLAVDDTGAGYASFNHVLLLRPDVIKLDRSLLTDIDTDPARRALVTAVLLLGLELGAVVVAEGVETMLELQTMQTLAIDSAQGYLLARPTTDPSTWQGWRGRDWDPINLEKAPTAKAPVPSAVG